VTENAGKEQSWRFKKGRSGNPAGKPKGARNKATLAVEALLDGQAEALTQAAISKALDGDATALRLCLDRIAPPRKGRPVTLELPEARDAADLDGAMAALVRAMADGEVTPDEAVTIANLFEIRRKIIETQEFEQRLAALEQRGKK
jgi:Family of unknown function (DUF5681)